MMSLIPLGVPFGFGPCGGGRVQEIAEGEARLESKLLERQAVQESLSELLQQVRGQRGDPWHSV